LFEDVDRVDHRTRIFAKFRMHGLFIHFATTDDYGPIMAVTAVVPVMHAPHATATPVKS
jgi:hypothetical protein